MTKKERKRRSDADKLHMTDIINKLFWMISLIYVVAQTYTLFAIRLATSVKFVLPPEDIPKPPFAYAFIVVALMLMIILACIIKLKKSSVKWKEKIFWPEICADDLINHGIYDYYWNSICSLPLLLKL